LIADGYAGKLHPRIAAGLAPLMNLQLRALEIANLEERIAKVEKVVATMEPVEEPPAWKWRRNKS
jgi:hypothetical protein